MKIDLLLSGALALGIAAIAIGKEFRWKVWNAAAAVAAVAGYSCRVLCKEDRQVRGHLDKKFRHLLV